MDILKLIGRSSSLFIVDLAKNENVLANKVQESSFLVLGRIPVYRASCSKRNILKES